MTFFKKLTINLNAEIHRWHKIKELKYLKSCGLRSPVCGWENREAGILNDPHYGVGSQSIWCRDRGLLLTLPLWLTEWSPRLWLTLFWGVRTSSALCASVFPTRPQLPQPPRESLQFQWNQCFRDSSSLKVHKKIPLKLNYVTHL